MVEIVLGPPGTGKTTRLLEMVDEELARGVPPDRIGFVSFTKRAAEEAATRAMQRFKLTAGDLPWFRTLHSLCFRRLQLSRGDVLEGTKLKEFAAYASVDITGRWSDDGTISGFSVGDRAIFMENLARVRCMGIRECYEHESDPGISWPELERVVRCLRQFKSVHGLLDYTDMLSEFIRSGDSLGLEVLLVDEAQDLSLLQWDVVRALARGCRRVVIAGDDDQAIYVWAGADVETLVTLKGDARVLDQSWRVPRAVQSLASGLVGHMGRRRDKDWRARDDEGSVTRADHFGDVDCSGADVLVLVRNNFVMSRVEGELRTQGIIYERYGHPSIRAGIFEAVTTWEKIRRGAAVSVEDARVVYEYLPSMKAVRRGHKTLPGLTGDVTARDLRERGGLLLPDPLPPWFSALDRLPREDMSYLKDALQRGEKIRQRPRVRLQTIHTAKGGEAQHVVLMLEMMNRTYREMLAYPQDEARVWYVAVTRAREQLTLVDSPTKMACEWL